MKRDSGGYSLIEALIVIAVSSTIFLGVATLFRGSRQSVDFNQAKIDVETKIKGYVNQVSTGTFQGNNTHICSRNGATGRPILVASGGVSTGSNEKCVYIGKALQFIEGTGRVYVYDVLGLRNKHVSGTDTGQAAANYSEAMTEPAGCLSSPPTPSCPVEPAAGNFTFLFVEEYDLPSGLRILYSRVSGNRANILKIYSSLQNGSASSKGVSVYSNDYQANSGDQKSNNLRNCLQEAGGACSTKYELESTGWDVCIENSDATKRTKMNIKPTSSGIVTTMTDGEC